MNYLLKLKIEEDFLHLPQVQKADSILMFTPQRNE